MSEFAETVSCFVALDGLDSCQVSSQTPLPHYVRTETLIAHDFATDLLLTTKGMAEAE